MPYTTTGMIELLATIQNANGIHCRPSAVIARETAHYVGEIKVISNEGVVDPRSVMALMTLGLTQGTPIKIRVAGLEEEKMCRRLVELFETHFDFPPREEVKFDPKQYGITGFT